MLYAGIALIVVGIVLVIVGIVTSNKAKRILAAPFRKTGEVASNPASADAHGMVSCEGTVKTSQPLTAPCTNQQCVYYHLKIEKKVKETKVGTQGVQQTTSWKTVSDQHTGSAFQIDDGSGPVSILAQGGVDADLEQTYSGTPPNTQPQIASLISAAVMGGTEQVLEWRATEKIIGLNKNLFAMGRLAGGQITKPDSGKLVVSTAGRDGLVGKTKRLALILFVVGGLLAVGGVPLMFIKPSVAAACTALRDTQPIECGVTTTLTDYEQPQSDGTKKTVKVQKGSFTWEVTKKAEYKIEVRQAPGSKGQSSPAIQAWAAFVPLNFGANMGSFLGDGPSSFQTTTKNWLNSSGGLPPGSYSLDLWANKDGPTNFLVKIIEVGGGSGSSSSGGSGSGAPAASSAPGMKSH